jgi:drug/metabolite transporter (DMT)-like permease
VTTAKTRPYTPIGLAAMSSGVFIWGIGVVVIKLTESPFLIVSFYRHAFSVPILLVAWMFTAKRRLPWRVAGVGGVLFAMHQVAHFSSLRYSTAAVVTILFSLQPILIGAFSGRVTGERTTARFYAWSAFAVVGCAILVLASAGQPEATPLGTLLASLNLVAWSAYYLATKRARAEVATISWLLVMTTVSGVIIGLLALVARQPFFAADAKEWWLMLGIALGPGTLGHLLVTWAQPRVHVAASSSLNLGVPIVASIGAAIFLNEAFGPFHALGALVALGGALAAMRCLPPPVTEEVAERFGEVAT